MKFEGVFVANVSLFDGNQKFDSGANKAHLEFLAEHSVQGFVPCGTTGESPTLSDDEQCCIISLSREVADKKGHKIIAGCGGNSTEKVLTLISRAADLGADAALVVNPYYNKPTQDGLAAHFLRLADKSKIPLVLYNIPPRTNVNLLPNTMAKLFEHENIVGVKEATGNYDQWLSISQKVDLTSKSLMSGDDNAFAAILALGGSGIISASANLIPEYFVKMYRAALDGQWPLVWKTQKEINSLVTALFIETNPAPVKFGLSVRRKTNPSVRLPLVEVSPQTQTLVKTGLNSLERLS